MSRYEDGPESSTAWSALYACETSSPVYSAIVSMSSSRAAEMMRVAISPLFMVSGC